ncbi:MAG: signal recognition particle subunit [Trizodia sp. TS-e1964]|nr:MAG: signal recognition particle subunit [Trizodia sp. TS-e1964]
MPPPPRPQIEDASDSDSDSEPSEMDPADFPPALPPNDSNDDSSDLPALPPTKDLSAYAHYQCLYPVYFDALRTRRTGRRVSRALASPNPLAREIVDAVAALGLRTLFEPAKTHPKDWANPGRVKVLLRQQGSARIKNSCVLFFFFCFLFLFWKLD